MLLNILCYILIDLFDVFGIMGLLDSYLPFDDPDYFESFELQDHKKKRPQS